MKESISFFCFSNKSRLFHMADIKKLSFGNNRTSGQDFFLTKTDEGEEEK